MQELQFHGQIVNRGEWGEWGGSDGVQQQNHERWGGRERCYFGRML